MSSVNEKTPTVSPDQDATGGAATSVQFAEIAEARMAEMAEVDETPGNFKITEKDFKKSWRRGGEENYFRIQQNNDNEETKDKDG